MSATATRPKQIKRSLHEQMPMSGRVDRENTIIYGVKLAGRTSPNRHGLNVEGTEYTRNAFESAIGKYEGAKLKADHPPRSEPNKERSIKDTMGKIKNVVIREGEPYGDLHLLKSHEMTTPLLDAAETMPDLFSLSHNADGVGHVENGKYVITEIVRVNSVDVVDRGATTRSLFESEEPDMKQLRESLAKIGIKGKRATQVLRVLEADLSGGLANRSEAKAGSLARRAISKGTSTKHAARILMKGSKTHQINPAHSFIHYVRSHAKDTPFAHFQEVAGHMGLGGEPKNNSAGRTDFKKTFKESLDEDAMTLRESLESIGISSKDAKRLFEMDLGLTPTTPAPEKEEGAGDWKDHIGKAILAILADPNIDGNGMRDKIMKVLDALAEPVEAAASAPAPMGGDPALSGAAGGGVEDLMDGDEDGEGDEMDDLFGGDEDDSEDDDLGDDDPEEDDDDDEDEEKLTMKESKELAVLRREKKARQLCESMGFNATAIDLEAVAALEGEAKQKKLIERLNASPAKGGAKSSAHRNVQESKQNGHENNRLLKMLG